MKKSFPLLHFVTDNLPETTKAPELDDANAVAALTADREWSHYGGIGVGVGIDEMEVYLSYLVALGFLPQPKKAGKAGVRGLPEVRIGDRQREALEGVGGRGGTS